MKESRKTLLRLIYQHEQVDGGIFQIPADGSSIGFDSLTLRNDVAYLCRHGYVEEPTHILRCYCLCLTPKGEEFVRNGCIETPLQPSSFSFEGATIQNAIIGDNAHDNNFGFYAGNPIESLEQLFSQRPAAEQPELKCILDLLRKIQTDNVPVQRGTFTKVSDFIKKHTDLIAPISTALLQILLQ